jgi:hypothetical protein
MLDPQPSAPTLPSTFATASVAYAAPIDDDLALGFECANPALQIERWGQDAEAQPLQDFS